MMNKLFQGDYIVALLRSPEEEVVKFALNQMKGNMHYRWIHYVDSIELMKEKYNSLDQFKDLIAHVVSQIYFYASNLDESVEWALKSKQRFDVNERSIYNDTILSIIVDTYIESKNKQNKGMSQEKFLLYENIVIAMLDNSFALNKNFDSKMLIGLSIETEKFQYIENYLHQIPETEFQKAFGSIVEMIQSHEQKEKIYEIFLKELLKHNNKDHQLITNCFMNLNRPSEHVDVLFNLLNQDKESCLQLLVDIEETGNLQYIKQIKEAFIHKAQGDKENIEKILDGGLKAEIDHLFLTQNNNVDEVFLKNLAKKWNPADSLSSNSFSQLFSLALLGTQDINLLKEEQILNKFEKVSHWALFSVVGSFGLIFKNSDRLPLIIKELKITDGSDYAQGGLLLAQGLSNFGKPLSEERKQSIISNLKNPNLKEGTKHGSALNLGCSYALTNDNSLVDEIQQYLYGENSNIAEGCGYAIGMIKATHFDLDLIENLINSSRNNNHDRIARSIMISLGLMALGNRKKVFLTFERLIKEQDSVLRFGAVQMLGMAYMNTADNEILNILLQIAATDLSNDVRRSAVLGITFVLLQNRSKAITLLTMLSNSYNEYVRHAVALSLGILGAHKYDNKIHQLLKTLWADKTFHVKQAVGIAWGMVCQLGTEQTCQFMKEAREEMQNCLDSKYEASTTKLGVYIGFGLIQSGGGNSQLQLVTKQGYLKLRNVIGIYMFCQYWYWFPLANFLGISLEPSYLVGVTSNLKMPRSFRFMSKAPKQYFDYFKTKVEDKVEKEKETIVLSVTNKFQLKNKKITKKVQEEEEKKKAEELKKKEQQIEEKMEIEKKPEPNFVILDNPSRIVEKQEQLISFVVENQRYQVVQPQRHKGIVFLKDTQPDQPEIFMNDLPKEKHLIPPQDFVFNEELNKQKL